jgi:hypothetical protein
MARLINQNVQTGVKPFTAVYLDFNLYKFRSDWQSTSTYDIGDLVFYNDNFYRNVLADNINIIPEDSIHWITLYWSDSITYSLKENDIIYYNDCFYKSLQNENLNNSPTDEDFWELMIWENATISNIPLGVYEGNGIVVTANSKTEGGSLVIDTIFVGEEVGTFEGNILVQSDAENSPNIIETTGTVYNNNNSFRDILGNKLDEEYEEYVNVDLIDSQYIDFDMTMTKNPNTGDVSKKLDSDSVIQSIRNLILNKKLWYGDSLDLNNILFGNNNVPFREDKISEQIRKYIIDRESRLNMLEITVLYTDIEKKNAEINIKFSTNNDKNVIYSFSIFRRIR